MALSDLTVEAIRKAIEEFDRLGRDAFLRKYGFREARDYVLVQNGTFYDSKAVAGAAHGYVSGQQPLRADEFSGGDATVRRTLERLGFVVRGPEEEEMPVPGEILTNDEITRRFAVGNMGGMRRSNRLNLLVLISDPFKGLYQDRWVSDVLHYTGMGKEGDQGLETAQNRTLAESRRNGVAVHLLEAADPKQYTYVGEVELVGEPYQEQQLDDRQQLRSVWMFPLRVKAGGAVPTLTAEQNRAIEDSQARKARRLTNEELRARAARAKKKPEARTVTTTVYARDAAVAENAKRLAKGHCDLCGNPAPFRNSDDEPYLECHHIQWLAKDGEDTVENTVALCPNCHRRMHILNLEADRATLRWRVARRG